MDNEMVSPGIVFSDFIASMLVLVVLQVLCFPLGIACFLVSAVLFGFLTGNHSGYGMLFAWLTVTGVFALMLRPFVAERTHATNSIPTH